MTQNCPCRPHLGVIVKNYPLPISETFVERELKNIENSGFKLTLISLETRFGDQGKKLESRLKAKVIRVPGDLEINWRSYLKQKLSFRWCGESWKIWKSFFTAIVRSFCYNQTFHLSIFSKSLWLREYFKNNEDRPDCFYCHFIDEPAQVGGYLRQLLGSPFGISAHAVDIYTTPEGLLRRQIVDSEFVTTCTDYNSDFLKRLLPQHSGKIARHYHGVDLSQFHHQIPKTRIQPERVRILSVNRLVEKKGVDTVLQALNRLLKKKHDFQYDIVGDGPLKEELLRKVRTLGLENHVQFHSSMSQEKLIRDFYSESDIFVIGAKIAKNGDRDGIPNTLLEAMAMSLCSVATDVSGIPEVLSHQSNGLLVPPDDPEEMAKALMWVISEPEKAREMGAKACQRLHETMDERVHFPKLLEFLEVKTRNLKVH